MISVDFEGRKSLIIFGQYLETPATVSLCFIVNTNVCKCCLVPIHQGGKGLRSLNVVVKSTICRIASIYARGSKVQIFWEGHKNLAQLPIFI